eukprot:TRINITY_DN19383_c0_g1::TRINITY_DN19383_c0_g1_i1::g.7801::m.7801 TRINITY_DN19383_c0_g1::TRINITY_DN19383_c0_g1_i1::g.7801  ORF type:complete len:521 (-),score=18.86,sp/O80605/SUC3_ARATH/29.47/1e-38,MFS_1/PF07690.11/3e-07,MFS_1/PF07690.11/8.9,MFS_1/PF07690.11/1e-10,MFS_2/PF13347.1/5.7e-07,MFS_2/PF13347.1/0.071,MFS_2/PF13347.1/1.1e+02,VIT1/PF01988.14/2.9e+02,VIT1/PF01988.14/0.52 TRINITY_DN19383_c0_g1_i1:5-1486(-)
MGKRRPFILLGALALAMSQLCYAWAKSIGEMFGDHDCDRKAAVVLAIISFSVLCCSNNLLQTPLRAMLAEECGPGQQNLAQAVTSTLVALGSVFGFLFGWFADPLEELQLYFMTSAAIILTTTCILLIASPARYMPSPSTRVSPLTHRYSVRIMRDPSECAAESSPDVPVECDMWSLLSFMPSDFLRVCIVQFCCWATWFCFLPIVNTWMGEYVAHGSPPALQHCEPHPVYNVFEPAPLPSREEAFSHGVSRSQLGLALSSVVQFLFSCAIPSLSHMLGDRLVLGLCFAVNAVAFFLMSTIQNVVSGQHAQEWVAVALIASTGIALAATNVFPFSILGQLYRGSPNMGLYMSTLNIFIIVPQMMDTFYIGFFAHHLGLGYVLFIVGLWSLLVMFSTIFLRIPEENSPFMEYKYLPLVENLENILEDLDEADGFDDMLSSPVTSGCHFLHNPIGTPPLHLLPSTFAVDDDGVSEGTRSINLGYRQLQHDLFSAP